MKNQLNNIKVLIFKGKITKSFITFSENKPNSINIKIGVSPFKTSKCEILSAGSGKKQTQLFILDVSLLAFLSGVKPNTNPIQTQYKPNFRNVKNWLKLFYDK